MKTFVIICALTALLTLCLQPNTVAHDGESDIPPHEVYQAATLGLKDFLEAITQTELKHFGFSEKRQLDIATLGEPLRIYTIFPDKLLNYNKNGNDLSSMLTPFDIWQFPVISEGHYRCLLTVGFVNAQWKAVEIGYSRLAIELENIYNSWPHSSGYDHKLIRIRAADSDFIALFKGKFMGLIPLTNATRALKFRIEENQVYKIYDPRDILPKLVSVIKTK